MTSGGKAAPDKKRELREDLPGRAAAIRREVESCRRCVLPVGSRPIVARYAGQRLFLLGQAPGKEEMARGYPFAGAAGRTLFRWFAAAGLGDEQAVRAQIFFTALAHCWPGTRPGSKDDLPPPPRMRAACAPHWKAELALIDPDWLVAVGAMAAQTLLGRKSTLAEVVGPAHEVVLEGRARRVLVLPHPSGLSRWLNDPSNLARHQAVLKRLGAVWGAMAGKPQKTSAGA